MSPTLPVCLLSWNGGGATAACIEAVVRSEGVQPELYVIDNASTDGSAERAEQRLGSARVLRLAGNAGYAGGMNAALEHMAARGAERCVLLTQDVIVEPTALAELAAALDADAQAAIVGPITVQRDAPKRLITAGGRLRRRRLDAVQLREPSAATPYAVDWVDGCCVLVRTAALDAVGRFDARYFLYFEETDLCCRLRAAEWRILVAPAAVVAHRKEGVPAPHYFYYMSRNRYLFWSLNFGVSPARTALALALDVLRSAGAAGRDVVGGSVTLGDAGLRLRRQLGGAVTGSLDYFRGRLGPRA